MAENRLYRTTSLASLGRMPSTTRKLVRSPSIAISNYAVQRAISNPNIDTTGYTSRFKSVISERDRSRDFHNYMKGWEMFYDSFWWNRRDYAPSLHWSSYYYSGGSNQRELHPLYSTWRYTPEVPEYPRRRWELHKYIDSLYPIKWHRHRESRPTQTRYFQYHPQIRESHDLDRAVHKYRQGLVDYKTLDRYSYNANNWSNRFSTWRDSYTPAGHYTPKRYYYSYFNT